MGLPFLIILGLIFTYTGFKAIQLVPGHPFVMVFMSLAIFLAMFGSMFFGRSKPRVFEALWFKIYIWISYTLMGFWGTFILLSLPVDLVNLVYGIFSVQGGFLTLDIQRGIFIAAWVMVAFGFISVLIGPQVEEVLISFSNLPDSLRNFKIVQISDLHIGPTIQSRYVSRVVKKVNAEEPDIIVITGDLVDSHTESIKRHLHPFANMRAKYGVFYVTGNHEYYWGIESLFAELEHVGMTILQNANRVIDVQGAKLLIAGIPDPVGAGFEESHRPDMEKAGLTKEKVDFKILLAHRPDPYHEAAERGFQLQFSGHTHAGQFFPFSLFIPFAHKYYRGLNQYKNLKLYVNSGTGYWGPANRFGISAEITLARLEKEASIHS